MATEHFNTKLAAIFYADVAGYSGLTGKDEEGAHRVLSAYLDLLSTEIEHQVKGPATNSFHYQITMILICYRTLYCLYRKVLYFSWPQSVVDDQSSSGKPGMCTKSR